MPSKLVHVSLKSIIIVSVILVAITGCAAPIVVARPTIVPTPKPANAPTTIPAATGTSAPTITATVNSSSATPTPTVDEDFRLWGQEITLDQFIELCKSGRVQLIEWFMDDDRVRISTMDNTRYNYRNAVSGLDIQKVLEQNGIKVGANNGGIPFDYDA
jgi:hypothetical protein